MDKVNALKNAVEIFGSVTALARALGVRQSTVSNWFIRGRVPAERCVEIQRLTKGEVAANKLRPDVFGDPEDEAA